MVVLWFIWASTQNFGTYRNGEERGSDVAAHMQSRQNLQIPHN